MIVRGTIIKLVISLEIPSSLSMDDVDFECEFYCYADRPQHIKKDDMKRVDKDNYLCFVDTGIIGSGDIRLITTAYIPDADYKDGVRKEIEKTDVGIKIV